MLDPLRPKPTSLFRALSALILREVAATHGRASIGYFWALLEPVFGIILLTFLFSFVLQSPPLGRSFALFYATGLLPFLAFQDISQKLSQSLRFSKQLLLYPSVGFFDALLARFLLNTATQLLIFCCVIGSLIALQGIQITCDPAALFLAFAMLVSLAAGVGILNCYLFLAFPVWERIWGIFNRPLFVLSGLFFLFETVPQPYDRWLWWNPVLHVIGQARAGFYATYPADFASPLYVGVISIASALFGLVMLRAYASDLLHQTA